MMRLLLAALVGFWGGAVATVGYPQTDMNWTFGVFIYAMVSGFICAPLLSHPDHRSFALGCTTVTTLAGLLYGLLAATFDPHLSWGGGIFVGTFGAWFTMIVNPFGALAWLVGAIMLRIFIIRFYWPSSPAKE